MQTNHFGTWLAKVAWESAFAVALAAALAVSTGGTSALFFRYLAGISGLGSLVQAAVAIARGRPLTERVTKQSCWPHCLPGHT